jgi:citrate synthase
VQDLADACTFEEVAYLIWHGELPDDAQSATFTAQERARRTVGRGLLGQITRLPDTCHPMDVLRTGISALGAEDPTAEDLTPAAVLEKSVDMFAKLPTMVAVDARRRRGLDPIAPDASLSYVENFFHMCFEVSMILYAEHSFNASTFTARVVASTLSDTYSSVTAAIGALKGPLHGGANEAVMDMMLEVGSPEAAENWLLKALQDKRKVMGFGHRVYKNGDSRVPRMRLALDEMAARGGQEAADLMGIYRNLEATMFREKGLHPNLDFPSGPAYHLMGFETPTFTPLFVMSRITGWTAHILEQLRSNALIRPLSSYIGPPQRPVPPAAHHPVG